MLMMRLLEEGTGPNAELGWLLYIAFGFFALMVLVGWLTSRAGAQAPAEPGKPARKAPARKEAAGGRKAK